MARADPTRVAARYLDGRPLWLGPMAETPSPLDLDRDTALARLRELADYALRVERQADKRLDAVIREEKETGKLKTVATRAHTALQWALRDGEAAGTPNPKWKELTLRALSGLEAWGAHE